MTIGAQRACRVWWFMSAIMLVVVSAVLASVPAAATEPSSRIFKLAPGGVFPPDVESLPDGTVLVAGGQVRRLALDGSFAVVPGIPLPTTSIATVPGGGLIFANSQDQQLGRVAADATRWSPLAGGSRGFAGDGGPATRAALAIWEITGIAVMGDGAVIFTDTGNNRIRRVGPDGVITTIAGEGPSGYKPLPGARFGGDGGPATDARLSFPTDVVADDAGGLVIADAGNDRVRRVAPDGVISTVATVPGVHGLAKLPDGSVAALTRDAIWRISSDGAPFMLVHLGSALPGRRGDFAGRELPGDGAIAVTPEGGLVGSGQPFHDPGEGAVGADAALFYVAPPTTQRTLVALRDARVSRTQVHIEFDATQQGTARLDVRRQGRTIASASAPILAGRGQMSVAGRFLRRVHSVRLTVTGPAGVRASDRVRLYMGPVLPRRLAYRLAGNRYDEGDEGGGHRVSRCRRQTPVRVDCEIRFEHTNIDTYRTVSGCSSVAAVELNPSGVVFAREYRCRSTTHRPFRRRPAWKDPAEALL